MENLEIDGSSKTPIINFDPNEGKFEIGGRSIPENAVDFYRPIYNWLDEYVKSPVKATELNIKLEYFNTSSSKCLLDVFKKVEYLTKNSLGDVTVNWYYEEDDEDMLEAGEDYDIIISIPFNFVSVEEL
ncbi:MAG: nuclear pore complex subunit [Crocinitomicaceae bacterium]|nr:nuclear pore complex subunit [Crocinitomicaceae bacterium]|tara:strand:- start:12023 stop:12409 length:387 start_codon:yes stop_codon:yes gene_type:complete